MFTIEQITTSTPGSVARTRARRLRHEIAWDSHEGTRGGRSDGGVAAWARSGRHGGAHDHKGAGVALARTGKPQRDQPRGAASARTRVGQRRRSTFWRNHSPRRDREYLDPRAGGAHTL